MRDPQRDPFTDVRPSRGRRRRVRRVARATAATALLTGVALLASVAVEQWGSAIGTARAQTALRAQVAAGGLPEKPIPGGVVGFLMIPSIRVDVAFVQGVGVGSLAEGPGHYPRTPLPGGGGNVAIAGHRTTHSAPFWALDALQPGAEITVRTRAGTFVYRVEWSRLVAPDDWSVLRPTPLPSLTLTTCNPRFSDQQRLVVRAVEVSAARPRQQSTTPVDL